MGELFLGKPQVAYYEQDGELKTLGTIESIEYDGIENEATYEVKAPYQTHTIEINVADGFGNLYEFLYGGDYMSRRQLYIDPVKKVIFHDPATVVYWIDGTKTVVKCSGGDEYDPEKGVLLCFMKRMFGNKGRFNDTLKKWVESYEGDAE